MPARKLLAASATMFALTIFAPSLGRAGDWLGGQYWGQIGGCASCGGSMYGGGLPPGAIWVGEIGWGSGCGCDNCFHVGAAKGDGGPIYTEEEIPAPSPVSPGAPRTIPSDEIVPDPPHVNTDELRAADFSRRVSYVEAVAPADREFRRPVERVQIKTHTSQPERLRREPIRIVSPDGSAGRMYR